MTTNPTRESSLKYDIHIYFDKAKKAMALEIVHELKTLERHDFVFYDHITRSIFDLWLTNAVKTLIYHPNFQKMEIGFVIKSYEVPQEILSSLKGLSIILQTTQSSIRKYKPLFTDASLENYFFYNVDSLNTFEEFHESALKMLPGKIYHKNSFSGWNKLKRVWETGQAFSLEELMSYILKNKIKHLLTVNMYYQTHLMKTESLLVLPIFKALGIEYVTFDYDTYDLTGYGFIQKAALNCNDFRRFSFAPHITQYFDQTYQNTNVRYFMIGDAKEPQEKSLLLDNPDICVISHARLHETLLQLPETLFFLQHVKEENQYVDFQDMFYALIHLLYHDKNLSEVHKEKHLSNITRLFTNVLSFLKYEVVHSLNIHGSKVKIYGDDFWKHLFPQQYQNKFLNEKEMEELLVNPKNLYLLLNQNYSYFENNPVFLRAINFNIPYLCFPSVVKTPDLEGLNRLEYKNSEELIDKIPRINELSQNPDYLKSLSTLRSQINLCRENFYSLVFENNPHDAGSFHDFCQRHTHIFKQKFQTYFKENAERIFSLYDNVINNAATTFPIDRTRFCQRPYFQIMATAYKQSYSNQKIAS